MKGWTRRIQKRDKAEENSQNQMRINILKMSILLTAIYRFNEMSIKILKAFFTKTE